ncbi:MAG: copper homeostasis protein CutC [Alphaproteobacteria bacterium]
MSLLEICVDTADGLAAAIAGGADRIELCSALSIGGLTPPPSLIALAAGASVPVFAMVRPRDGDFVYTRAEAEQMHADLAALRGAGGMLRGFVTGANRTDGGLDADLLGPLLAARGRLSATLHRAFDLVPDPIAALEQAVDLGFDRILTSGLAPTAAEGADLIAALVARAAGRIVVMPGGGIRPEGARDLVARTGAVEVHASAAVDGRAYAPDVIRFEFAATPRARVTDEGTVRALKAALACVPASA